MGLHIVQVVPSLAIGGQETIVLNLCEALQKEGARLSVVVFSGGGELRGQVESLGLGLYELHKRPGLDFRLAWSLYRLLDRIKPDVLHAHNVLAAFYAALAARARGIPLVFTRHGTGTMYSTRFRSGWLATRLCSQAVGVSKKVSEQLMAEQGLGPDKISTVPNGVDSDRFRPDAGRRESVRRELGLGPEETLFITIGRLAPEKNYPLLIQAAAELQAQGLDIKLAFVGDGAERDSLEGLARDGGLGSRALFLGVRHDIPGLLNAADVFCLSSRTEGAPMSILEAMASGLPVVSTDCGGVAELVGPGETGFLVPVDDCPALSQAMARLVREPELAAKVGAAARDDQIRRFSSGSMAQAYLDIYSRLIG